MSLVLISICKALRVKILNVLLAEDARKLLEMESCRKQAVKTIARVLFARTMVGGGAFEPFSSPKWLRTKWVRLFIKLQKLPKD